MIRRSGLAMAVLLVACGSDEKGRPKCQAGSATCSGNMLQQCQDGSLVDAGDCFDQGLVCVTAGSMASCQAELCPPNATRCTGNIVERCTNNAWTAQTNCADAQQSCVVAGGNAACQANTCNVTAFTPTATYANSDFLALPDYQVLGAGDQTVNPLRIVQLENYPIGYDGMLPGQTGSKTISGDETTYDTCGVCVLGGPIDANGQYTKILMAEAGTVEYVAFSAAPGGDFHVILRDIVMREVTINASFVTTDVPGGERWCFAQVDMSALSEAFTCNGAADSSCTSQGDAAQCTGGSLVGNDCGGLACVEEGVYGAECVEACATQGDDRCNNDRLQQCNGSGWVTQSDCAANGEVCDNTMCAPGCAAGENGYSRCNGTLMEACNGVSWQPSTECATQGEACFASGTSAYCAVATCTTATETRCIGGTLQTCDGAFWQETTPCTYGCGGAPAACLPEQCSAGEVGTTRCAGNVIETCTYVVDTYFWVEGVDCALNAQVCDDTSGAAVCS